MTQDRLDPPSSRSSGAAEILLVEDNPDDVEMTLKALRQAHVANRIHVAKDGEEALTFLFGGPGTPARPAEDMPVVILLDVKLPKVDGLEVLRRIKREPATQRVPVVMLSASSEERDVAESYQLGVNSYIVKPVNFEQFAASVTQLGMYWVLMNSPPNNAH
jgi:two-component system, response regulator